MMTISLSVLQGQYRRLLGSLTAVKQRAPRVGGNLTESDEFSSN